MNRVVNFAEKGMWVSPPNVISLAANTATELLPDTRNVAQDEIAYRYIQNVGDEDIYICVGTAGANGAAQASVNEYHSKLLVGSTFDCSNNHLRVCGIAVGATAKVALSVYYRK